MKFKALDKCQYEMSTQRTVLTPLVSQHMMGLWPHMSNPEISTYLAWTPHPNKDFCLKVIESLCQSHSGGSALHWTIFFENTICGLISLIDIRMKHISWTLNRSELAYWIAPEYQNKGLVTEACLKIIDFGFNVAGLHKIIVAHASENLSSEKVIKKLGFRYIGQENDAFNKDGQWHNLKHYELINHAEK